MTQISRIIAIIGRDRMERLVREFGGMTVYIPLKLPDEERDDRIRLRFSEHLKSTASCMTSYGACADEFGLSVRRIQEIVNGS